MIDDEIHGRPPNLMGPLAAKARLIPDRYGALWRRFAEAAEKVDASWEVHWCPSHLKDEKPQADAAEKLAKANLQAGWKDEFLDMNKEADAPVLDASPRPPSPEGLIVRPHQNRWRSSSSHR